MQSEHTDPLLRDAVEREARRRDDQAEPRGPEVPLRMAKAQADNEHRERLVEEADALEPGIPVRAHRRAQAAGVDEVQQEERAGKREDHAVGERRSTSRATLEGEHGLRPPPPRWR